MKERLLLACLLLVTIVIECALGHPCLASFLAGMLFMASLLIWQRGRSEAADIFRLTHANDYQASLLIERDRRIAALERQLRIVGGAQ